MSNTMQSHKNKNEPFDRSNSSKRLSCSTSHRRAVHSSEPRCNSQQVALLCPQLGNNAGMTESNKIGTSRTLPENCFREKHHTDSATNCTTMSKKFGAPVNGFHPQLSARPNSVLPVQSQMSPFETRRNARISDIVTRLRIDEHSKLKRRNTHAAAADGEKRDQTTGKKVHKRVRIDPRFSPSSPPDLFGDMFQNSSVPQLITAPGGRLVAWNQTFVEATGLVLPNVPSCLTVFDLVAPKMLPHLYELFALALRNVNPTLPNLIQETDQGRSIPIPAVSDTENDTDSDSATRSLPSNKRQGTTRKKRRLSISESEDDLDGLSTAEDDVHAAMVLPCVRFPSGHDGPNYITIALMNDVNPNRRCFYCILSNVNVTKKQSSDASDEERKPSHDFTNCCDFLNMCAVGEIVYLGSEHLARILCLDGGPCES